jgi:hypothetical protein
VVVSLWSFSRRNFKVSSVTGFGLIAGLGVPVLVLFAGKYPVYYSWMGLLIVSLCAVAAVSNLWDKWQAPMRLLGLTPLMVACVVGLPSELYASFRRPHVPPESVQAFIRENVSHADHVFVDAPVYYATVGHAAETYCHYYSGGRGLREMPDKQRSKVTVLVINPVNFDYCVKKLGGEWVAGANYQMISGREKTSLTVYRRAKLIE